MRTGNQFTGIQFVFSGLLFLIASGTNAQSPKSTINDEELRLIRNLSQTILKVRGQERSQVTEDTRDLNADLDDIQASLTQAYDYIAAPTVSPTGISVSAQAGNRGNVRAAPLSSTSTNGKNKKEQIGAELEKAIRKLDRQNKKIQASLNRMSNRSTQKGRQLSRVEQKLQKLIDDLNSLSGASELDQRKKLKSMLTHLREQRRSDSGSPAEPTVTTRMTHRQRGS